MNAEHFARLHARAVEVASLTRGGPACQLCGEPCPHGSHEDEYTPEETALMWLARALRYGAPAEAVLRCRTYAEARWLAVVAEEDPFYACVAAPARCPDGGYRVGVARAHGFRGVRL